MTRRTDDDAGPDCLLCALGNHGRCLLDDLEHAAGRRCCCCGLEDEVDPWAAP